MASSSENVIITKLVGLCYNTDIMEREKIESRLKEIVVTSLDLEDITVADIETDIPLFGEGLGLDSIDALELGMAVKKEFGITFSSNPADNKKIFHSVKSLADYIESQGK